MIVGVPREIKPDERRLAVVAVARIFGVPHHEV
jgi:hypothetical protein